MARAIWNNTVLAESDVVVVVGSAYYFPPEGVDFHFLHEADVSPTPGPMGVALYYDVVTPAETLARGAWSYRDALAEQQGVRDYVAFGQGVEVNDDPAAHFATGGKSS